MTMMHIKSGEIRFYYEVSEEGKKKLFEIFDDGKTSQITFYDDCAVVSDVNKKIDEDTLNALSDYFKLEEQNPMTDGKLYFSDFYEGEGRFYFDRKWHKEYVVWLSEEPDETLHEELQRRNHAVTTPISNLFLALQNALDEFPGYEGLPSEKVELYSNMKNLRESFRKMTGL